ncbi:hypothetical protein JW899_04725 [Candidatus Uhrbacteria bacterium]|nr:hypothetical protein [Candidatus Uhrbacteria bacterium]
MENWPKDGIPDQCGDERPPERRTENGNVIRESNDRKRDETVGLGVPAGREKQPAETGEGAQESVDPVERETFGEALGYEPFESTLEVAGIRQLSPEDRALPAEERQNLKRERLESFRAALNRQIEGIAETVTALTEMVRENPDETAESLMSAVWTRAPESRFTAGQLSNFLGAITEYRQKHEAVVKYRELYPDDADLFEACFGRKPAGAVRVIRGPMTLNFECLDRQDFVFAYGLDFRLDDREMTDDDVRNAGSCLGMAQFQVLADGLNGTVTVLNVPRHEEIRSSLEETRIHEEQHQINRLFIPVSRTGNGIGAIARTVSGNGNAEREDGKRSPIRNMIRREWECAEMNDMARDEILAHYREGATHPPSSWRSWAKNTILPKK